MGNAKLDSLVKLAGEILVAIRDLSFPPKSGTIELVGELDGVPTELVGEYTTQ